MNRNGFNRENKDWLRWKQMLGEDDDQMYIFEDLTNHQEGDQPLKRLEDIVGEIKRDLVKKSNINVTNSMNLPHLEG